MIRSKYEKDRNLPAWGGEFPRGPKALGRELAVALQPPAGFGGFVDRKGRLLAWLYFEPGFPLQ